jgi:hypothetical protein
MSADKRLLPEEQELEHKRAELEEKQNLLADRELELATSRSRLIVFEQIYIEKVGRLYVELDELQAQLAGLRSTQLPDNRESAEAARQAQQQAEESRSEYEQRKQTLGPPSHQPESPPELKALYRTLAKQFHPDATLDPQEKTRRSAIMAQINDAYARGDLTVLQRMSDELAISPEAVSGDGIGAELIRVIRKIAQIDRRLAVLELELAHLEESDLSRLAEQYEDSRQRGQDLLEALAADVTRRIVETRVQIASLEQRWTQQ